MRVELLEEVGEKVRGRGEDRSVDPDESISGQELDVTTGSAGKFLNLIADIFN